MHTTYSTRTSAFCSLDFLCAAKLLPEQNTIRYRDTYPTFIYFDSNFFLSFFSLAGMMQLDLQGPVFSQEPPHKIEFSNSTGGHIECSGHGSPQPEVMFGLIRVG